MSKAIRRALAAVAVLALAACQAMPTAANVAAATEATISAAQADVQKAINIYQISKGIAQVGCLADPAICPVPALPKDVPVPGM